ncbi:hypothetical protein GF312_12865 [Candidatus Poribacteria bacterium]|nr:hypothetical protein [Candidatus Poribacteria bacterium]
MRKTWLKPKLIVLVKGTPDERVLVGCKGEGPYDMGPDDQYATCQINGDFCGNCETV